MTNYKKCAGFKSTIEKFKLMESEPRVVSMGKYVKNAY
jgi:hypothetical protein